MNIQAQSNSCSHYINSVPSISVKETMSNVSDVQKEISKILNGDPSVRVTHTLFNSNFNLNQLLAQPVTKAEIKELSRRERWLIQSIGGLIFVDRCDFPAYMISGTDEVIERRKMFTVRLFNPDQEGLREKIIRNLENMALGHYAEYIKRLDGSSLMITIDNINQWKDVPNLMHAFIKTANEG